MKYNSVSSIRLN